eukprot:297725_1
MHQINRNNNNNTDTQIIQRNSYSNVKKYQRKTFINSQSNRPLLSNKQSHGKHSKSVDTNIDHLINTTLLNTHSTDDDEKQKNEYLYALFEHFCDQKNDYINLSCINDE